MKRMTRSIVAPLKQPLTWFTIVLGGLSLFNLVRAWGWVDPQGVLLSLDQIYASLRDALARPLEGLLQIHLNDAAKNLLVLFGTIGRAYASALSFLVTELSAPPKQDAGYRWTYSEYKPFQRGFLKWVYELQVALGQRLKPVIAMMVRPIIMALVSLTWPALFWTLLRTPVVTMLTQGGDPAGQPHPSGRGQMELPPFEAPPSPKFPLVGNERRGLYDVRGIAGAILLGQFLVAAAGIVAAGLITLTRL